MPWSPNLTPIDGGFRITETPTHYIDVLEMMFNWRIVATPKDLPCVHDRAYCYIGKDQVTFVRAVIAAEEWATRDVLNEDPIGWDKDAARQRYSDDYLARERERFALVPDDHIPGYSQDSV